MEKKFKKKKKKPLARRWLGSAWPGMALDPIVHCPRAVLGWPLDVSCRHGLGRWHASATRFAPLIWLAMQNIASSSGMGIFSGKFEIERKTSCWVAECFEEEELYDFSRSSRNDLWNFFPYPENQLAHYQDTHIYNDLQHSNLYDQQHIVLYHLFLLQCPHIADIFGLR